MSMTDLARVQNEIQKFWSPQLSPTLRENHLLVALAGKDYQGEIKKGGDTVKITQVADVAADLLTVGTDENTFSSQAVDTTQIEITANKRASVAYEFSDLIQLQTILDNDSKFRDNMVYALSKKINDYLYTLVSPSTSSPDHTIVSTDMNVGQLSAIRKLAAQAKWPEAPAWYGLLDPSYYSDVLDDTTMSSSDFSGGDAPMVAGKVGTKRFGFQLFEDNSRSEDYGIFFHPNFLQLVVQREIQFEVSSLHSNKQYGYLLSANIVFGARLGHDGAKLHIKCTGS